MRPRGALADLIALAVLLAVVLAFFAPVLLGPWHLPAGGGDLASFLFPRYRFIAERYLAGDLPLWNPHQDLGAPLAADNQAGLYYPPLAALFLLWPRFPYGAMEAMAALHVLIAGICAYAALRLWRPADRVARPAAVVGALAWMLGDVMITHLGNLNFDAAAAWLPLALVGLHRACDAAEREGRLRAAVAAGVALGVGALAGHAQVTFLSAVALTLWALWRLAAGAGLRALEALGIALVTGLGLAGVMVLPAAELRALSERAALGDAEALAYSLPPAGLLGLAMPGFFGRGAAAHWAPWPRVELGYAGVLTLVLAGVALGAAALASRRAGLPPRYRRDVLGMALLGALAVLLALGAATPLHGLLVEPLGLPFRAPARFLLVADLALAWLAAFGLDAALRHDEGRGLPLGRAVAVGAAAVAVPLVVGAMLALGPSDVLTGLVEIGGGGGADVGAGVGGALDPRAAAAMGRALAVLGALGLASVALLAALAAGRLRPSQAAGLAVGLLAVDLVGLGSGVEIDRADPAEGFRREAAADWLRREAGPGLWRIDGAAAAWQPGAAQLHGLYDIGGVYNPLRLGHVGYYLDGLRARGSGPFDLLGTRYVISDKGVAPSDDPAIALAFDGDPAVDVWQNAEAVPRLTVVPEVRVVSTDAAAYDALHAAGWDPLAAVVLTAEESARVQASEPPPPARGMRLAGYVRPGEPPVPPAPPDERPFAATSAIQRYGPDAVTLVVHPERPGWARLADAFHPGWRADVNGVRVPIARADFALRAVRVPAGCSLVELRFRPASWPLGAALSVATLLAAAGILGAPVLPRRR